MKQLREEGRRTHLVKCRRRRPDCRLVELARAVSPNPRRSITLPTRALSWLLAQFAAVGATNECTYCTALTVVHFFPLDMDTLGWMKLGHVGGSFSSFHGAEGVLVKRKAR